MVKQTLTKYIMNLTYSQAVVPTFFTTIDVDDLFFGTLLVADISARYHVANYFLKNMVLTQKASELAVAGQPISCQITRTGLAPFSIAFTPKFSVSIEDGSVNLAFLPV
jgi:hypothetical protein